MSIQAKRILVTAGFITSVILISIGAVVKMLIEHELGATRQAVNAALREAARKGDTAEVRSNLAQGADPNERDPWGETALNIAAESPVTHIINGMGSDGVCHRIEKHRGYSEIVPLLVKHGAAVNVKNREGVTPLQQAESFDDAATVQLLRKAGAVENLPRK